MEPAFTLADGGLRAELDPTRPATVRAYLPGADRSGARAAVARVSEALGHLQAFGLRPIGELRVSVVQEADWAHAWKRHFPVLRVGRSIVIRPSWRRYRTAPGDVVIALDPGMAFGTGLHPSTRLCLTGIERWAEAGRLTGRRLLDLGCGSGILAIAAVKLGAASVLGLDTDPLAVEATGANARRNRLGRAIDVRRGSLPSGSAPFELVVANLVAPLLVDLTESLTAELVPGGRLLAGGIHLDREAEVRRAFAAAGLALADRREGDEWVTLETERIG